MRDCIDWDTFRATGIGNVCKMYESCRKRGCERVGRRRRAVRLSRNIAKREGGVWRCKVKDTTVERKRKKRTYERGNLRVSTHGHFRRLSAAAELNLQHPNPTQMTVLLLLVLVLLLMTALLLMLMMLLLMAVLLLLPSPPPSVHCCGCCDVGWKCPHP